MNKKTISLLISVILTLLIFSMSVLSGNTSGELSLGLTSNIKEVWDQIFTNHPIALETLHGVIRKGAHVIEYFVLGISYYFTAKYWHLSILKVMTIGLLTAGVDELLQTFVPGRAARWIDIFLYDFGGFVLGLGLMLLILNRKAKSYNNQEVLKKVENNNISLEKAYAKLYDQQTQPLQLTNHAHFVKLRIIVPDEPGVNKFLRVLFFIPFPLVLVRIGLLFVKDQITDQFSKKDILEIIGSKGIHVNVNAASGEIVKIKII